jgi:hypothetical protein
VLDEDLSDAEVDFEVWNSGFRDMNLSRNSVACVIADSSLSTGPHILESPDIWIADTDATSHVTKHAGDDKNHPQINVRTQEFAGETIKSNN